MASRAAAVRPTTSFNCSKLVSWRLDGDPRSYGVAASLFRLNVRCLSLSWMPARRCRLLKATRFQNLRHIILNAHLEDDLISGTERGEDKTQKRLNVDAILVLSERFCITAAAAVCAASMTMYGPQHSRLVVSSTLEPFIPQKANLPLWQGFFLIAALIINAILRARQWQGIGHSRVSSSKLLVANYSVEERMKKLEEETASVVTIIRVLSKQLEKLAVRFRVTRQTLRDPIQETALLAQKTSESVDRLAAREHELEKSLEEVHHVLLKMQENQAKQLELISTLGKLVKHRPSDKSVRAGVQKDQAGMRQGRWPRIDNGHGVPSWKKSTERIGQKGASMQPINQSLGDRSAVKLPAQERARSEEPSNRNTDGENTRTVDFWLSTPAPTPMKEPVPVGRSGDDLLNEERTRSTPDSSYRHSDAEE